MLRIKSRLPVMDCKSLHRFLPQFPLQLHVVPLHSHHSSYTRLWAVPRIQEMHSASLSPTLYLQCPLPGTLFIKKSIWLAPRLHSGVFSDRPCLTFLYCIYQPDIILYCTPICVFLIPLPTKIWKGLCSLLGVLGTWHMGCPTNAGGTS